MKKTGALFLNIIGVFVFLLTFSSSVTAAVQLHSNNLHIGFDSHRNQNHYRHNKYYGHNKRNNYYSNHRKHHYQKHNVYGHYNSHNNSRHNNHSYPNHIYYRNHRRFTSSHRRYNQSYSSYRKPCHQVSKVYYDEDGVPHNTTGTMCYDQYGEAYIVSGSRYRLD